MSYREKDRKWSKNNPVGLPQSAAEESVLLPVLVVDDDIEVLKISESLLRAAGLKNVISCQDSRKVMALLSKQEIGVILLDLTMPHLSGEELLPMIVESHPEIPVVIVTGSNRIEKAVQCMKMGAFDYMVKPVEMGRMISRVHRVVEVRELQRENSMLKERMLADTLDNPEAFSEIATQSSSMRAIFKYAEMVATTSRPILITGETGVGKELIAKAIHRISGRAGNFIGVNAAGLDDTVFSDTLFGHVPGTFTGADNVRKGLVEQAARGTLFLDEIGDLNTMSQVKLLRILQEHEYFPLGSDIAKRTDARLVVATNCNLEELQSSGRFRPDLFYRLKTHHIHIPPLRERLGDLPVLLDHFLGQAAETLGKKKPTPPPQLRTLLAAYYFPGNVRELESMVFDAVSKHESRVLSMDVFKKHIGPIGAPRTILEETAPRYQEESPFARFKTLPTLKESTQLLIAEAMKRCDGNQSQAARLLGLSRSALNKRLNDRMN